MTKRTDRTIADGMAERYNTANRAPATCRECGLANPPADHDHQRIYVCTGYDVRGVREYWSTVLECFCPHGKCEGCCGCALVDPSEDDVEGDGKTEATAYRFTPAAATEYGRYVNGERG